MRAMSHNSVSSWRMNAVRAALMYRQTSSPTPRWVRMSIGVSTRTNSLRPDSMITWLIAETSARVHSGPLGAGAGEQPPGQILIEGGGAQMGHGAVEEPNRRRGGHPVGLRRWRRVVYRRSSSRLPVAQGADQILLRRRDGQRRQVVAVEGAEHVPQQ